MSIVDRVKNACVNAGIPLSELERSAGLGANTIYRWDTNLPRIDRIMRVAECLNTSVDYLVGLTDKKTPVDSLDGLTDEELEVIRLFAAASPSRQEAILALLRAP